MKNIIKAVIFTLVLATASIGSKALAASPYLSLSNAGGDNVTVNVNNADSYSLVQFFYTVSGSSLATQISNFGTTSGSGSFSTVISSSAYGLTGGAQVYVMVNGQQSNIVSWNNGSSGCGYYGCNNVGGLTFSQTNVSLNAGQSTYVSISSGVYMNNYPPYVSSNSNSNVASASISGNQLYITGNNSGSTTITVCLSGGNTCGSVYVTVSGSSSSGLSLSQTSVTLNAGQSSTVTAYTSYPLYQNSVYVSNNSNSSVVSASVAGNLITIYGNTAGSATITVCANSISACGSIYVTVNGSGYNQNITFSQSSISLDYGQSRDISIYGGNYYNNNNYYISSNSNSSAVSASISGSILNLYGKNTGSSTVTVCQYNNSQCGTVYVTVSGSNAISLSQTSLSLSSGQIANVIVYGNGSYYISGNSNPNVAGAMLSGNALTVNAYNSGSTNISVCQNSGNCATLYVTVNNGYSTISTSQTNLNISQGQTVPVTINGGYSYYISANTNPNAVSATLSGSTLNLYGNSAGYSTVTVCQTNTTSCVSVGITVSGYGSGNLSLTTTNLTQPTVGQYYNFQLQATGGNSPYYYSIQSGQLPAGLSLSSAGLIFGTPQNNAAASFVVRVYDNYNHNGSFSLNLNSNSVLGASAYNSGTLINEGGTVYIIYKNSKTGFASAAAFLGLGYQFDDVINVGTTNIPFSGYTVSTANTSHPWGSWIKSGQTVYFAHEFGLIPVPDWNTFLNNGGNGNLVVLANSYDFARPILSVMVTNDTRLK